MHPGNTLTHRSTTQKRDTPNLFQKGEAPFSTIDLDPTKMCQNTRSPVQAVSTQRVLPLYETRSRQVCLVLMIVLTVSYVLSLICFPGLMVVGVMALGGATPDQVEQAQVIFVFFLALPVSLLLALVGGWIFFAMKWYWTAPSMAILPILNIFAVAAAIVWVAMQQ